MRHLKLNIVQNLGKSSLPYYVYLFHRVKYKFVLNRSHLGFFYGIMLTEVDRTFFHVISSARLESCESSLSMITPRRSRFPGTDFDTCCFPNKQPLLLIKRKLYKAHAISLVDNPDALT